MTGVVAMARGRDRLTQIAKDLGVFDACVYNWLKRADIEDGRRSGVTVAGRAGIRELEKRNRLLQQGNEALRKAAAYLLQAYLPGK